MAGCKIFIGLLLFVLLGFETKCEPAPVTEIETTSGRVWGFQDATSTKGTKVFKFLGIPYAMPPIGGLRFKDPVPFQPGTEEALNATQFGSNCPQMALIEGNVTIVGDEDCLTLNVYTPALPRKRDWDQNPSILKPVMVFIHGGAFTIGSGQIYNPDKFLDRNVVIVTFNYRLGALGFMSLSHELLSGNMGLKDQNLALTWVSENINHFGGDPDRVTIFGESAGSISVHAHMLSPRAQQLFHAAIAQSGSTLSVHGIMKSRLTETESNNLKEALNCGGDYSISKALICLQSLTAEEILQASMTDFDYLTDALQELNGEKIPNIFYPVVDDYASDPILPRLPLQSLVQMQSTPVPFLTGVTSEEGALLFGHVLNRLEEFEENWPFICSKILFGTPANEVTEEMVNLSETVRYFYLNSSNFTIDQKWALLNMTTDLILSPSTYEAAQYQTAISEAPVYYYHLTHRPTSSYSSFYALGTGMENEDLGVSHADDLLLLFKPKDLGFPDEESDLDVQVGDFMVDYWTNFAKYHDPSPFETEELPFWKPMSHEMKSDYFMELGKTPVLKEGFHPDRMLFWQKMFWQGQVEDELQIKRQFQLFQKFQAFLKKN